jgi:hypothetical protein
MRFIPLAALLLVAAAPAEKKLKAPKPVSMTEVVKASLAKGSDWTLDEMRAKNLGYAAPPATKEYVLDGESAPTQHAIMVTLGNDTKSAVDVMVSSTSVVEFAGAQPAAIDGYTFRSDLDGKLISAIRARGKVESVMQEKLDVTASDTKKRFAAVLATVRAHPVLRKGGK